VLLIDLFERQKQDSRYNLCFFMNLRGQSPATLAT
jgi:hypothetical protein